MARFLLKSKNQRKGFTLIEIMIAITVVEIGIVGIYSAIWRSTASLYDVSSRFTAFYLAREGLELVRNIRDTNWLQQISSTSTSWDDSLTNCSTGCKLDYSSSDIADPTLSPYQGGYLKIDNNGFYNYSTGQRTIFKRKIMVNHLGDDILNVKVEVTWQGSEKLNSIEVQENLYNWKPG